MCAFSYSVLVMGMLNVSTVLLLKISVLMQVG